MCVGLQFSTQLQDLALVLQDFHNRSDVYHTSYKFWCYVLPRTRQPLLHVWSKPTPSVRSRSFLLLDIQCSPEDPAAGAEHSWIAWSLPYPYEIFRGRTQQTRCLPTHWIEAHGLHLVCIQSRMVCFASRRRSRRPAEPPVLVISAFNKNWRFAYFRLTYRCDFDTFIMLYFTHMCF